MSTLNAVLTVLVVLAAIVTSGFILPAWGVWRERPAAHTTDDQEDETR